MKIIILKMVMGMVLTIYIAAAWLSVLCFACLPRKLPAVVNVLLYLSLSIIDINKLTILISILNIYDYSKKVSEFVSLLIQRDIILVITLITFTNVYLTAESRKARVIGALLSYVFLVGTSQLLRAFHVLKDVHWNFLLDLLLFAVLMVVSLLLGRFFLHQAKKEGRSDGERHL